MAEHSCRTCGIVFVSSNRRVYCSDSCSDRYETISCWYRRRGIFKKILTNEDAMVWEMHRPPEQTGDVNIVDGEVRDRIKELRTQGLNYKEIARVMHLNKFSVYDILEGLV